MPCARSPAGRGLCGAPRSEALSTNSPCQPGLFLKSRVKTPCSLRPSYLCCGRKGTNPLPPSPSGRWLPALAMPDHPLELRKRVPGTIPRDSAADLQMGDFSKLSSILRCSHIWDPHSCSAECSLLSNLGTWSHLLRLDLRSRVLFHSLPSQCRARASCASEREPGSRFCCHFLFRELLLLCEAQWNRRSLLQVVLWAGPLFVTGSEQDLGAPWSCVLLDSGE